MSDWAAMAESLADDEKEAQTLFAELQRIGFAPSLLRRGQLHAYSIQGQLPFATPQDTAIRPPHGDTLFKNLYSHPAISPG